MAFQRTQLPEEPTGRPPANRELDKKKPHERARYWQTRYAEAKAFHSREADQLDALETAYAQGHTPRKRPLYKSAVPMKLGHSIVETMVALLTESRPDIQILARDPDNYAKAKLLEEVLDFEWDTQQMPLVLQQLLRTAFTSRIAYLEPWWNPYKHGIEGGMEARVRRRQEVFRDPAARHWTEMEFLILESTISAEHAWIRFPEQAKKMKVSGSWGRSRDAADHYDWIVSRRLVDDEKEPDQRDCVTVREVYYVQASNKVGVPPKMMHYQWCEGHGKNELVELKEPAPVVYGKIMFPIIPLYDIWLADDISGMATMELIDAIQDAIFVAQNMSIDIVNRTANPRLLYEDDSIEPSDYLNKPGQMVPYRTGAQKPEYEKSPTLNVALANLPELLMQRGEWVTGIHEATFGRTPQRVESGRAIATLDVAGQRRMRPKATNLEWAMRQWAQLTSAYISAYWNEDRWIRVSGDISDAVKEELQLPTSARPNMLPVPGKLFKDLYGGDLVFDFVVRAGSTLPKEMDVEAARALEWFKVNALDLETLMEITEWPQQRKRVLERLRSGKAIMMRDLAMMGQQGLTGPMSAQIGGVQGAQTAGAVRPQGQG